jgi:hypothetical protein
MLMMMMMMMMMMMSVQQLVECLAGETEVVGENLPQCRFVDHKSHTLPRLPRLEASYKLSELQHSLSS